MLFASDKTSLSPETLLQEYAFKPVGNSVLNGRISVPTWLAALTLTAIVLSVGIPVVKGRQAKSAGTYFSAADVVRFNPDSLTIGLGE